MRVAGTWFDLEGGAYEIYLSGCNPPHCPGCHNPELWDFDIGLPWEVAIPDILKAIQSPLVSKVAVMGGEPLHQDKEEFAGFMETLDRNFLLPIYVFTRNELEDVDLVTLSCCDYVKTGGYRNDLPKGGVEHGWQMASENQKIVPGNRRTGVRVSSQNTGTASQVENPSRAH